MSLLGGTTLGAKSHGRGFDAAIRPVVGDDVILGTDCTVFGCIEIGHGVSAGAKAVVLESVPGNTTVVGIPARVV